MSNIIGADAAKLAGLQIDTLQKVRLGQITLDQWGWFNNLSFQDRERLVRGELGFVPPTSVGKAPTIQVATTLPDLDYQKAYAALTVTSEEYQEGISKLKLASDPRYWTQPMLSIVRKEKKNKFPLITCNRIGQALRNAGSGFKSFWYEDLDANVTENDRDPYFHGSYSRSFLRSIEAQEFGKASPNEVKERERDVEFSTLLEGLFLELAYFVTTGSHLDIKHWTVHLGSRHRGRTFPHSYWGSGDSPVKVSRYDADSRVRIVRARPAVSLQVVDRVCEPQPA